MKIIAYPLFVFRSEQIYVKVAYDGDTIFNI